MIFYLDTSAWVAWKFKQKGQEVFTKASFEKDTIISSPLLASEYSAFLKRIDKLETTRFEEELSFISWISPIEPLFKEYVICLEKHSLKGADLHHLACALWFAEDNRAELHFLTCDNEQKNAAKLLGFQT